MGKKKKRLEELTKLLPPRFKRLVDVGCDHAILGKYCLEDEKCKNVLAIDLREKPLNKAGKNLNKWMQEGSAELKLNYGLCGISLNSGDAVVIAGIGGLELADILSSASCYSQTDWKEIRKNIPFVVQPGKSLPLLRMFLSLSGAEILRESILIVRKRAYVSMLMLPPPARPDPMLKYKLLDPENAAEVRSMRESLGLSLSELFWGRGMSEKLAGFNSGPEIKTGIKSQDFERINGIFSAAEIEYLCIQTKKLMSLDHDSAFIPGLGYSADFLPRLFRDVSFLSDKGSFYERYKGN